MNRIYNFNAGPSALPLEVLKEVQDSFLNFNNSGMSIVEISHRSKEFDSVINGTKEKVTKLFELGSDFEVLFVQGGASMQFAMLPMNLLKASDSADYVNTGTWSTKAINEIKSQNRKFNVVASSEDSNFSYIPKNIKFSDNAKYVHITTNNTIKGTQWHNLPDTNNVPIVADMSSDIMSYPIDAKKFGLIYAGAQKNLGVPGVCLVIIRKDLLNNIGDDIPVMLNYKTYAQKNSMYNTPPCFSIYVMWLILKWIEEKGGLSAVYQENKQKAEVLYDFIDNSSIYTGTAEKDSRSFMNVTFLLKDKNLEEKFIQEATKNSIGGIKGHRSVGGFRASIYNSTDIEKVKHLVNFMDEFQKKVK